MMVYLFIYFLKEIEREREKERYNSEKIGTK